MAFLESSPEDPFLLFALAKEFEKSGQFSEALSYYKKLTAINPGYVGTYYHFGKLLEHLGEFEQALHWYETGMEIAQKAGDLHSLGELSNAKTNLELEIF